MLERSDPDVAGLQRTAPGWIDALRPFTDGTGRGHPPAPPGTMGRTREVIDLLGAVDRFAARATRRARAGRLR